MIKQLGLSHSNAAEIHFNGPQLHRFSRFLKFKAELENDCNNNMFIIIIITP